MAMTPESRAIPAVDPCNVSVLDPAPVAVTLPVKVSKPAPEWSITPPPVVPARLMTRSVVCELPVTTSEPVAVRLPRSITPVAAVSGAPRELEAVPPLTLLSEATERPPPWIHVFPV